MYIGGTRQRENRRLVQDIIQGLGEFFADPKVTERSLILSDMVCYEIWGGSRGWEEATDEQFDSLVQRLKEKLRDGSTKEEKTEKKTEVLDQLREIATAQEEEAQPRDSGPRYPGWRRRRPHG